MSNRPQDNMIPYTLGLQIDAICDRFESAWKSGQQPQIESYLGEMPEEHRAALFYALLGVDLNYRKECDKALRVDDYVERFPAFRQEIAAAFQDINTPSSEDRRSGLVGRDSGLRSVTVAQFIERLTNSGLVSAAEISTIQDSLPPEQRSSDVQSLAGGLVKAGKLTEYQAQAIYQGELIVFDEYVVLDKLGEGGMGVVLKARHRRMKRLVAVKVIGKAVLKSPHAVRRFYREVEATANLEHPNIVTAYDAGEYEGVHYLVMQYVDGKDLGAIVKQHGPLPVHQAVECIIQAARGLQYAHEKGIVHRDIKPANLLMDNDGTVKILDMGLARIAWPADDSDQDRLTDSGQVMGTCDYLAPEQALDTHAADHRADIYSLGCTLYRLLTGQVLFKCETLAKIIWAHQQAPVPSLCQARSDVPPQLDVIFQKMVAKKPDDRYQSMAEVAAELEALSAASSGPPGTAAAKAGSPSGALGKTSTLQQGEKPLGKARRAVAKVCQRPLVLAGLAGGLVLLLGIALAVIGPDRKWKLSPGAPPPAIAPFDEKKAKEHQEAWAKHLGVPVEITNSIGMKLVLIPPGEFMMGSPKELIEEELKAHSDDQWYTEHVPGEGPQHRVRMTKPFYLGVYLVTQEEYQRVMGNNPSEFSATGKQKDKVAGQDTKRFPVEYVSWYEAVEFCRKLSEMPEEKTAGRTYLLPSDAQWEYACRAGSTGRFSWSRSWTSKEYDENALSDYVWFNGNSALRTHAVGGKRANTWGLYDIQGNVFQWCRDAYQKDYYAKSTTDDPAGPPGNEYRVKRGCGYCSPAWEFRAAYRIHWGSSIRWPDVGFRVSLVLPDRVGAKTTPTTGTQATSGIQPSPFTGPDGKWKLPPGSPLPAVAPFDATKAKEYQTEWAKHLGVPVELTNSIGMKLMLIPPGEFMMGSPDSDKDAQPTERPQHRVRITKPFYMGKYPVTQQEYQQVIGSIPKQNLRGSSPRTKGEVAGRETRRFAVGNLSWEEMVEFCRRMSSLPNEKAAGRMYRLPSEAQWEYACRAGTTTRFCFGDDVSGLDEYGWPEGTWSSSSNITPPVGEKKPNAWGLYDIYANVWQFCADWFDATYYANSPVDDPPGGQLSFYVPPTVDPKGGQSGLRICRGGGWNWPKKFCRSADRNHYGTGHQEYYLGFRASLVFADNSEDQAKVTRGADAAQPADQTGN